MVKVNIWSILLGLFLILVVAVVINNTETVANAESMQIQSQVGRYQLFQGYYKSGRLGKEGEDTKEIFLLDTVTGDVKKYFETYSSNSFANGWQGTTNRNTVNIEK